MLYGASIYFTTKFGKAMQYCNKPSTANDSGAVFVAQVTLGLLYLLVRLMTTHKRHPTVDPHACLIIRSSLLLDPK